MAYANSTNHVAILKELYKDPSDVMKDVVYAENPWLALIRKDESPDGMSGKYFPVPLQYSTPSGRSRTIAKAQSNQNPSKFVSFFVEAIEDYQIVTITNKLMKQTASNIGAFVDAAQNEIDGGFRNITNNLAFDLFSNGTGSRGVISGYSNVSAAITLTLATPSDVVNFETGMVLRASATAGGAVSDDTATVDSINRITGAMTLTCSDASPDSEWGNGGHLSVDGDVPTAGFTNIADALCLSGMSAWLPATDPSASENFWGVDRSVDPTRLAGLRYDASALTIEEGITNALALLNREGGKPDLCILDFGSFAALVNSLGAKVQYIQVRHDTVDVAFEGITFVSAYGRVTVLADRSCPAQTAFILTTSSWKLRSMGPVPEILTYGMEGLEGLRVSNDDALEIRIGYYANLTCSAPAWNIRVALSA